jgi:hypothetical protein
MNALNVLWLPPYTADTDRPLGQLLAAWRAAASDPIRWILNNSDGVSDWARASEIPTTDVPFRTTDSGAQIAAMQQGLGITTLPCFVGDADKKLVRVRRTPPRACSARSGSSSRASRARPSACGCSPSSYPAGSPRTRHFSRDCPLPATDKRQVADDACHNFDRTRRIEPRFSGWARDPRPTAAPRGPGCAPARPARWSPAGMTP